MGFNGMCIDKAELVLGSIQYK